jgi:hypothetical protein
VVVSTGLIVLAHEEAAHKMLSKLTAELITWNMKKEANSSLIRSRKRKKIRIGVIKKRRKDQVSIPSTFYKQLLRVQVPKAQKD